ncbi:MAG: tetratricopeptide repeat protein [Thiobacillus sp.]
MPSIADLESMLAQGRDNALLRFSLGSEHLKHGDPAKAAEHLRRAVEHDPAYSAAWKLLGRALADSGALPDALAAYRQGIEVAEARGDKQAAREMGVFVRRIEAALPDTPLGLKFSD